VDVDEGEIGVCGGHPHVLPMAISRIASPGAVRDDLLVGTSRDKAAQTGDEAVCPQPHQGLLVAWLCTQCSYHHVHKAWITSEVQEGFVNGWR
jgi:hypothetical protein